MPNHKIWGANQFPEFTLGKEIFEFPQAKCKELAEFLGHSFSREGSHLSNSPRIEASLDPQKKLSYSASKLITC